MIQIKQLCLLSHSLKLVELLRRLMENNSLGTLSICIPTYNRADIVVDIVRRILSISDSRLRVLVQDNCSSDNTVESLNSIIDNRLYLFKNPINYGGAKNSVLSLCHSGISKYYILMLDRDEIDFAVINSLLEYLDNNDIDVGRLDYKLLLKRHHEFIIYNEKKRLFPKESIIKIHKLNHPTGWVFSNSFIRKNTEKISSTLKQELLYPIEIILLSSDYSTFFLYNAMIESQISQSKHLANTKSNYVKDSSGIVFLSLDYLKSDLMRIIHLIGIKCRRINCIYFLASLYSEVLYRITVLNKKVHNNDSVMQFHYNITRKNIRIEELMKNLSQIKRIFKEEIKYLGYHKIIFLNFIILFIDLRILLILLFPILEKLLINPINLFKLIMKKSILKTNSIR